MPLYTLFEAVSTTERSVAMSPSNDYDPIHCLLGSSDPEDDDDDDIVLDEEEDLDLNAEFADPVNHDYRLQAISRFRGAAPDGSDKGPYAYETNIYYVSTDGDDESDGLSMQHAWRTFSRAAAALEPGDTLYLAPGLYQANRSLTLAGTAEEPISIRGRGAEPALIRDALRLTKSRHVRFERLQFIDAVHAADSEGVHFKNCRFHGTQTGLDASGSTGLHVRHC